jgi:hypothetical protein
MTDKPEPSRQFVGFQFGLFHLFAVMTIAALTLSALRVIQLPREFLLIVGGYLVVYACIRGPFLAIKLSRLWQRRQQLLVERRQLERQLVQRLEARRNAQAADQSSDDGRSRNKFTV